jgi:ABC-type Fe3+ transport system permease subunit
MMAPSTRPAQGIKMAALNALFYAVATFLLAEMAKVALEGMVAFDPDRWTDLYTLTGFLLYAGPAFFVLVAIIAVALAGDERERRRRAL